MAGSQDILEDPRNERVLIWLNGRLVPARSGRRLRLRWRLYCGRRRLGRFPAAPWVPALPGRASRPAVCRSARDRPRHRHGQSRTGRSSRGDLPGKCDGGRRAPPADGHARHQAHTEPGPTRDGRLRDGCHCCRVQNPTAGAGRNRTCAADLERALHPSRPVRHAPQLA